MFSCGCGRSFKSEPALAQHRADKQMAHIGSACRALSAPKATKTVKPAIKIPFTHEPRDSWMWKGTRTFDAFHVVSEATLEPCVAVVSSEAACELICSYSWQDSKQASIKIPGFAPIWRRVPLPITLPEDKGTYFIDQNTARVPQYPFEPVFRAAEVMNPAVDFADVDIVINRNSLRKFLDFCAGTVKDSFRVNLSMISNTLFIERHEKNTRELIRGAQVNGWGHSFEKTFTKLPKGLGHSTQHHRVVRYAIGGLNCVVRFEVDACYQKDNEEQERIAGDNIYENLTLGVSKLSIGANSGRNSVAPEQIPRVENQFKLMPQSTAAEIKTSSKNGRPSSSLPQLWFGRTPWLIRGYHVRGTFNRINITNAGAKFVAWETEHQVELRKMVSLLSQLRESVKKSGFKRCMATCEKRTRPRELKVFAAVHDKGALPDDLVSKFWRGKSHEVAVTGEE
ncbi:hypothetical protein F5B21DRAFT_484968 [Xylaria acuta]|nr:hypothetical protein F5B21DRAFT_484968 [Xylaria acuta]